ncbi:hypothetical protein [Marinomonas foliarum]|uniref:PH (Pleckstrin Homology) domain-containing protein n=1 Tax=Marinomonas foliarum TaxID=491950 RepID=A0ABX7ILG7_9GAMM|nr:hypothetical protein [Marinomonas foliarum]QRV22976.1 hypothetical protein JSY38_12970 [Marinomonas foliarum]
MSKQLEIETPEKVYHLANQAGILVIGFVFIVLGVFITPFSAAMGVLMIALYIFKNKLEAIRIFKNHSEIKLAPASSRWLIKDTDIRKTYFEKNILTLEIREEGQIIIRKIPIKAFSEGDRNSILKHYKDIEAENTSPST